MLGGPWQRSMVLVTFEAIMRAIELNGVAIDDNKQAFAAGRLVAAGEDVMASFSMTKQQPETLRQIVDRRAEFLGAYQNANYAQRYTALVESIRTIECGRLAGSE